jgi:hypothetical protein
MQICIYNHYDIDLYIEFIGRCSPSEVAYKP